MYTTRGANFHSFTCTNAYILDCVLAQTDQRSLIKKAKTLTCQMGREQIESYLK